MKNDKFEVNIERNRSKIVFFLKMTFSQNKFSKKFIDTFVTLATPAFLGRPLIPWPGTVPSYVFKIPTKC